MVSLGEIQAMLTLEGFKKFSSDLKGAEKKLADFGAKANKIGTGLKKTGGTLSKNLTLPIVAAGAAAIKMAADFEVSSNKFKKAFEGAADSAADSVELLNEKYGLAQSEATKLLANTGDLLKGFGATSEQALGLSTEVQKLAVSLAAYNGIPVAQSSIAVTKALLGETESMKTLGVVIKQTDVTTRLAEKGMGDLEGQALLLAKAQVTLELATEQSTDAIKSLSDNQGTAAFQTSALIGDLKDLSIQFGTILLPIVKAVVEQVRNTVQWFSNLSDSAKTSILVITGLAAAIGPIIALAGAIVTGIGAATVAIGALNAALIFLAANPVIAAAAGIAAITLALTALIVASEKAYSDELAKLSDTFEGIGKAAGITTENMDEFVATAGKIATSLSLSQPRDDFEEVNKLVNQLVEETGFTASQVAEIGIQSDAVTEKYREQLVTIRDEALALENITKAETDRWTTTTESAKAERLAANEKERSAKLATEQAALEVQIATALKAQKKQRDAALKIQIEGRKAALATYSGDVKNAQTAYNLGLINQRELLEANASAAETQADALIAAGYNGVAGTSLGNIELTKMVATITDLNSKIVELDATSEESMTKAATTAATETAAILAVKSEYASKILEQFDKKEELLELEKQSALKNAEEIGAGISEIKAYYAEEERLLKEERLNEKMTADAQEIADAQAKFATISNVILGLGEQIQAITNQQITNAKAVLANFLAVNGSEIKALKAKEKTAEGLTAKEKKRLDKLNEEKKKLMQEQYDRELQAFYVSKALNIAQTVIQGATAAISAFQAMAGIPYVGPILGAVAAAAVGTFTAVQVGFIAAQQPPPKPFATGGIVNNPGAGINAIVGEAGPEAILPLSDSTFNSLGQSIVDAQEASVDEPSGSGGGLSSLTIVMQGLGTVSIPITQDAINNREIIIPASSIVEE